MIENEVEIWKDIIGYEKKYQISNFGNVNSKKMNELMKLKKKNQYYEVVLLNDNIEYIIHRIHFLVAKHFINNNDPINKIYVYHNDKNKLNNKYNNLRWSKVLDENDFDNEIWKAIMGYEDKYQISNHGRIKVKKTGQLI